MTWIYGRGLGAPYYWDESYAVELAQYTYGNEDLFRAESRDIRFPGHSIWTYAVFSGGVIGGLFYVGLFAVAVGMSLHSTQLLQVLAYSSPISPPSPKSQSTAKQQACSSIGWGLTGNPVPRCL